MSPKNPYRIPFPFCASYVRMRGGWKLLGILYYLTGIDIDKFGGWEVHWYAPGWYQDIRNFYLRGRYGWCPRDVWNLDDYWGRVMAGSLEHLADRATGFPAGFPDTPSTQPAIATADDTDARFALWQATLRRWAKAFSELPDDVDIYDDADGYKAHCAEEERRREQLQTTLKELAPWWEALWD